MRFQGKEKEPEKTKLDQEVNTMQEQSTKMSLKMVQQLIYSFKNMYIANFCYLDSSATKHVLGNKSRFKSLKKFKKIQNVKSIGKHTLGCVWKRQSEVVIHFWKNKDYH